MNVILTNVDKKHTNLTSHDYSIITKSNTSSKKNASNTKSMNNSSSVNNNKTNAVNNKDRDKDKRRIDAEKEAIKARDR